MLKRFSKSFPTGKRFIFPILLSFLTFFSFAQTGTVTGTVLDPDNKPVEGASVTVKDTKFSIVADKDGNFSIKANKGNIIIVTSVNFKSQEIAVGDASHIVITLQRQDKTLNDVVVVGYGTQTKATVSGAITTIDTKDVSLSPAASLGAGLAGRAPGVVINNRGGEPGNEAIEIFVRGKSTTGDATPLYVIDGIVRDYNALSFLPPSEIETITVLKDASAAIYGSRAANGVILITTKRGISGKPLISANYNQGWVQQERIPESANSYLFASMSNLEQSLKGLPLPYTAQDLQLYKDGTDPLGHPNTNWQNLVFKPWSNQQRADVTVAGGSPEVKYFLAAGYLGQNSPFNDSYTYNKEYHFRSNIDAQINKDLKVSLDLAGRVLDNVRTNFDWAHVFLGLPTAVGIYPNGDYGSGRAGQSALNMSRNPNSGNYNTYGSNFTSTLFAEYKIPFVQGLSLQGNFAYDYNNSYSKFWQGVTYYYVYDNTTNTYTKLQSSNNAVPTLSVDYPNSYSITSNLRLAYRKTFAENHTVDAFIEYEQNRTNSYDLYAQRTNYASQSIEELFAGDANKVNQSNTGASAATGRQNLFGRALYSYMEKYNLQFLFRYDGSQNFPVGKRYGFFPGISGNWMISKENFMANVNWLDYLKIRGSWGELGNDKVGPYQYLTSYTYGNNYAFDGSTNQGLVQTNVPNPNITWEVAKMTDIGLETGIFKGLLRLELDYFYTLRSNILAFRNASVPAYTGLTLPNENIGKAKNEGFEINLSHSHRLSKDFRYNIEANFMYAKNTVLFIDETPGTPSYQKQTGQSIGTVNLFETAGIYKTQSQIDQSPHQAGTVPGDLIYRDINGDGQITSLDQVRQPYSPTPRIIYGVNFTFDYKRFELILGFQGQGDAYGEKYSVLPFDPVGWGDFPSAQANNAWSPDNPNGTNPAPGQNFTNGTTGTTWRFASMAFLKLKTAEISYNFSPKVLSGAGIKGARLYVNGSNLFFIHDNYKDINLSPEQFNWGWGMNQQRIINLGINITL